MTQEFFRIVFFFLVCLAVALEIIADILFKKWSINNRNLLLFLGFFIYFIGTIFWAFSLKYEYLSKAISIFTLLNLIVLALVGLFYFKENLSIMNKIGIILGILSAFLIEA